MPHSPTAALGWSRLPAAYAIPATAPTLAEAREYCARLARTHYENFSVASWFLPQRLRQHFFNVYAYCRISDDLGDEVGDTAASLELLDQWQHELDACYEGSPKHPVFVALAETVRQFDIPKHEFSDLLIAFRQDQTVTRFETFDDVLAYCHYSANPVGHLVLYLCGYRDPERQQLSDFTCTALQLANFWQDVTVDYAKGRIYLPLEDLRRFNVSEDDIAQQSEHAGLLRHDEVRSRARRRLVPPGPAADFKSRSRTRHRPRSLQPRRPGNPARNRRSRTTPSSEIARRFRSRANSLWSRAPPLRVKTSFTTRDAHG